MRQTRPAVNAAVTPANRLSEKIFEMPKGSLVTIHPSRVSKREPGGGVMPSVTAAIE